MNFDDYNLDKTGQHYMIDKSLIQFIIDSSNLKKTDVVLEIGFGKGALTKELVKKCKVVAIDIEKGDLDFIDGKLIVIHGNILDKFEELESKYKFNKIVANIPYTISEPLFRKIFKSKVDLCVLTVGKNFADTIAKKDNRIGIISNSLYDVSLLKSVSKKAFHPMPRVESAVIKIERKKLDGVGEMYRQLIFLDDKKLKNSFEKILTDRTKKEIKELTTMPFFSKKLYELDNNEFILLDKFIHLLNFHG